MNKYDKIYNDKLDDLLKDVIYPSHWVVTGFRDALFMALRNTTPDQLQCSIEEYAKLVDCSGSMTAGLVNTIQFSMPSLFLALTAVKRCNSLQLGLSLAEYLEFIRSIDVMVAKWQELAEKHIREAQDYVQGVAKSDFEKEQRMKNAKNKIIKPR
jgi:predicted DNA-binding protein (UPF0278 family)